jgi:hypothetical protein
MMCCILDETFALFFLVFVWLWGQGWEEGWRRNSALCEDVLDVSGS